MFSSPQVSQVNTTLGNSPRKKPWFLIAVIILLCLILGLAVFALFHTRKQVNILSTQLEELQKKNPILDNSDEAVSILLQEVGKLIVLPVDEQPTVATVSDLSQLQGQPFFEQAKIDDKVIIYSKAKKAILYRPSEKKVINIAPLINDVPEQTPTAPAAN